MKYKHKETWDLGNYQKLRLKRAKATLEDKRHRLQKQLLDIYKT